MSSSVTLQSALSQFLYLSSPNNHLCNTNNNSLLTTKRLSSPTPTHKQKSPNLQLPQLNSNTPGSRL